jgi:hypothetical protein
LAIVIGTPRRIAQDVVGEPNELERLFRIGAIVAIGVPHHRAPTVGDPDLLR